MEMLVTVDIELEHLARNLNSIDSLKLVKFIDISQADYAFTETMTKYFIQELYDNYTADGYEFNLSDFAPQEKIE